LHDVVNRVPNALAVMPVVALPVAEGPPVALLHCPVVGASLSVVSRDGEQRASYYLDLGVFVATARVRMSDVGARGRPASMLQRARHHRCLPDAAAIRGSRVRPALRCLQGPPVSHSSAMPAADDAGMAMGLAWPRTAKRGPGAVAGASTSARRSRWWPAGDVGLAILAWRRCYCY
jgi:hypothetical protein